MIQVYTSFKLHVSSTNYYYKNVLYTINIIIFELFLKSIFLDTIH